jgi:hypothetical protein
MSLDPETLDTNLKKEGTTAAEVSKNGANQNLTTAFALAGLLALAALAGILFVA